MPNADSGWTDWGGMVRLEAELFAFMKPEPEKPVRYGLSPAALVCLSPVIVIVAVCLLTKLLWSLVRWLSGGN